MRFRIFAILSLLTALSVAAPPNIVIIYADDLGYGDVGCYNPERGKIPTPHIDRLGEQGVRFTNAYVTASTCSPSRGGLLTGRYQQRFGFEFNTSNAPGDCQSIIECTQSMAEPDARAGLT